MVKKIYTNTIKKKNKEKEYRELAECIKMGQVSSDRIQKHFVKDPKFEKWYIKNALNKYKILTKKPP